MRRFVLSHLLVLALAVFAICAAYLFIPEGKELRAADSKTDTTLEETETDAEETTTEVAESTSEVSYPYVFIGDGRALFLGTSETDDRYANLVKNEQIFAKFGGLVNDETLIDSAADAGELQAPMGIFWIGINDVEQRENKDDETAFIADYQVLIDQYLTANPNGEIAILSILTTATDALDFYEAQQKNIKAYNQALQSFCEENGFNYIDITDFSIEDAFFPDGIHFTKDWMQTYFPEILERIPFSE